jgi:hypothetical protein
MKYFGLIIGDALVLALTTLIGFASHAEFTASFLPRMAATLFPLLLGWFLLAPSIGLYRDAVTSAPSLFWRPAFVMLFAGSLAAILRGLVLGAPVMPNFAIVLGGMAAVGLTLWRLLWALLRRRAISQR